MPVLRLTVFPSAPRNRAIQLALLGCCQSEAMVRQESKTIRRCPRMSYLFTALGAMIISAVILHALRLVSAGLKSPPAAGGQRQRTEHQQPRRRRLGAAVKTTSFPVPPA